ncbi:hypothetical protein WN51_14014 [Melipona quadrifasciata]|uniref:Uncharacterized protein n=1 Tax=Melipona quadrifasciata TaxID=166423 RepID=A0A0M9A0M5_9HYME|nr:hypothetical protein WN51_14014 [Melipona quadrifasciata]
MAGVKASGGGPIRGEYGWGRIPPPSPSATLPPAIFMASQQTPEAPSTVRDNACGSLAHGRRRLSPLPPSPESFSTNHNITTILSTHKLHRPYCNPPPPLVVSKSILFLCEHRRRRSGHREGEKAGRTERSGRAEPEPAETFPVQISLLGQHTDIETDIPTLILFTGNHNCNARRVDFCDRHGLA